MHEEPVTPADIKNAFEKHSQEDAAFQAITNKSLASIHQKLEHVPTKEDIAQIVSEVITQLLLRNGKIAYTAIIGGSALVAALVVILGGFKTVLGWLGFIMIGK